MKYFFPINKNVNRTLSKKQKQTFKKGQLKGIKMSLKKKKKRCKYARERYRNLSEEEKEKNVIIVNIFLKNEKQRIVEYIKNQSRMPKQMEMCKNK